MRASIRRFLLGNLLLALVAVTIISAFGDYYLSRNAVRENMDALLEQMGTAFTIIVTDNLHSSELMVLEKELNALSSSHKSLLNFKAQHPLYHLLKSGRYYFQLWDDNGKLLLYSNNSLHLNLNKGTVGLSDIYLNHYNWRVFKVYDTRRGIDFIVGERYDLRNQLLHEIGLNNLYVMLVTYLIAGLMIWFIIGWGFKPLKRITNEVSNRAPAYLEPVAIEKIPIEIKPLIQELNNLFARLHEAFEREKRFAGDAAHELRTPLAALKIQAQVIAKTDEANERQQLLEALVQGVDRITHIVQQLLVLSRLVPEAASVYELTDVNLSKITAEMIAQLYPSALDKEISMELEAPDASLSIQGNLTSLSILIRNLVDNAIRYTERGGHVRVELAKILDKIVLTVIDNGPGIPKELRERVFERFYRVVGTSTVGSGLGLAIVRQIADLHQAVIKLAAPASGKGLQIQVSFKNKD